MPDNCIASMTDSELDNLFRLWAEILKTPSILRETPHARQLLRVLLFERVARHSAHKFQPVYSPSGRGASLAIARACGDSTYAHYRDSRR